MPVVMQSLEKFNERYKTSSTPLKILNMGPDLVLERNVAGHRVPPKYAGSQEISYDTNNIRNRGRHKERENARFVTGRDLDNNEVKVPEQNLGRDVKNSGEVSDADSDSVRLSVKERVQLLNSQSSKPEVQRRGRSMATRGWMKKRDQSAPPANRKNQVFPTKAEIISPSRRSRSIERPQDSGLDKTYPSSPQKTNGIGIVQQGVNLSKSQNIHISEMSAFSQVGKPQNKNLEDKKVVVMNISRVPSEVSPASPRSWTREDRLAKHLPQKICGNRQSPSGSHIQNVVNSLRQKETGLESNFDGTFDEVTGEKSDQPTSVSVKRMVSFIHKGGEGVMPPLHLVKSERTISKGCDSDKQSLYSSSQNDSNPSRKDREEVCQSANSIIKGLDKEQTHNQGRPRLGRFNFSELKSKGVSVEFNQATPPRNSIPFVPSLESKIQFPKTVYAELHLSNQMRNHLDSPCDGFEVINSPGNGFDGTITNSCVAPMNKRPGKCDSLNGIDAQKPNDPNHGDAPFAQGKRQVFNLHYKSDSSLSNQSDNRVNTKQVDETRTDDPEWDEIVAKSYALDILSKEIPHRTVNLNEKKENVIEGRLTASPYEKPSTPCTFNEIDSEDVFDKSMHPLDFALAIRDISESAVIRSSDQSHDGVDSPRDGVVVARRMLLNDETDGHKSDHGVAALRMENDKRVLEDGFRFTKGQETECPVKCLEKKTCVANVSKDIEKRTDISRDLSSGFKPVKSRTPNNKKESYSGLTMVNLKSEESFSKVEDVTLSPNVSVEVEFDPEEDYVQLSPSYKPPLNPSDATGFGKPESERTRSSNATPSSGIKLRAKSRVDVKPDPPKIPKPKISSASPEKRRPRSKGKHRRFPSKSSAASTGSVSLLQSSQGSSNNDTGGYRRSRGRKSSVLSPALSGRRSNPPPNDITVTDPHCSFDSVSTPPRSRSQSRTKHIRSNSEVSLSSASSQLNRFFDMMGLDSAVLTSILQPVSYEDDSVFQDMHTWRVGASVNSSHSGSFSEGSRISPEGVMNMKKLKKLPDQSQSIITKNARVIKWLVQCKKSQGAISR